MFIRTRLDLIIVVAALLIGLVVLVVAVVGYASGYYTH